MISDLLSLLSPAHAPQPIEKNRPPNQFQRFQKRPAPVHKLGHFGMCVTNFAKALEFYSTYFNFFPSEVWMYSFPFIKHQLVDSARPSSSTMTKA